MHPPLRPLNILLLTLLLTLLLPATVPAQILIVEVQPGAEVLAACNWVHLPSCEPKHIDGIENDSLILDGQPFVVDWTGWGYYLDSGVVLEPMDEAVSASGRRRWLETYPDQGKVHVSLSWSDADGDGKLSVSDALTLESGVEAIREVRLHTWIRSVSKE